MAGSPLVNPFIFVNFVPKYIVIWGDGPIFQYVIAVKDKSSTLENKQ